MATKYNEAGKGSVRRKEDKKKIDEGWDRIWGSKNNHKEDNMFVNDDSNWDEDRMDVIGQNGNTGDYYIK